MFNSVEKNIYYITIEQLFNRIIVSDMKDGIELREHAALEIKMIEDTVMYDLADFFKMFSDSTRVKILLALHNGEMAVFELASLLNMSLSAISHQLRSLRQAKLVKSRRDGKNIIYALDDDHVGDILALALEHLEE